MKPVMRSRKGTSFQLVSLLVADPRCSSQRYSTLRIRNAHALGPEEIATLGQSQPVLSPKESMNPVAQHGALAHKETSLAQHFFYLSGGLPADMHPRNEVTAEQIGQNAHPLCRS